MGSITEVALADMRRWIEEAMAASVEPLKARASKLLGNVRSRLEDFNSNLEKLASNGEREFSKENRKTYRFARVASKFGREALESLANIKSPEEITYKSLSGFYEVSNAEMKLIEQKRAYMYQGIAPYFIFDRLRVDSSLKRVTDILKELESFLDGDFSKLKVIDDAVTSSEGLLSLHKSLEELKEQREKLHQELSQLNEKASTEKDMLRKLEEDVNIQEFSRVRSEADRLQARVSQALSHLRKPFRKLGNLAQTSGVLMQHEKEKMEEYLTDPFIALATEKEGYPLLKELLRKLERAFSEDKLALKSSRVKKASEVIDGIVDKNSLLPLQLECVKVLQRERELSASDSLMKLKAEIEAASSRVRESDGQRDILASRSANLEREGEEVQTQIKNREEQLKKTILELTNMEVSIVK